MSNDLDAALRAAHYLAGTVATIRALLAEGLSKEKVNRFHVELNQKFRHQADAIEAVAHELKLARECKIAKFGGIVTATAAEAAIQMVYALNQEWFGEMMIYPRPVTVWPDEREILAEAELEVAAAKERRNRSGQDLIVDWDALKEVTKGAAKQYELIKVLVEAGGWVDFDDLTDPVWNGEVQSTGAVKQMVKRANKNLKDIKSRLRICHDDERAKIF